MWGLYRHYVRIVIPYSLPAPSKMRMMHRLLGAAAANQQTIYDEGAGFPPHPATVGYQFYIVILYDYTIAA